ncbi:MAG: replication-relaxation family protein [Dehalococcoidia bacterium]|nr:replication-relaxation family protein [Dehalococcoidia bacterium]
MMRRDSHLILNTLHWLARLPFLAVDDLALLTGQPTPDVEGVLREMRQAGLVDMVAPSSPELDSAPLHVLTEPTRHWLRSTLSTEVVRTLPLAWRDMIHGLARLEATVAFNTFAAGLVASLRRSPEREVADFRGLPVRRPQDAWWPSGVQGYGCIRSASGAAPFFVMVDRAGTPAAHRAALIAGWYRFRDGSQRWGNDIPPILILCPGPAREDEWARAVLTSAEWRDTVPLRVLTGGVTAAPGERTWRRADGTSRAALMEWLPVWHAEHLGLPLAPLPDLLPPAPSEERVPLHRWTREVACGARTATTMEHAAAVALTTSLFEKELIECLARHPLLSEAELVAVLHRNHGLVRRAVERATDQGLVVHIDRLRDASQRYCLGPTGLRLLAARDGVPVRRYARHVPVTVFPANDGERVPTLLQQYEHTVGANSFFVAWLDCPAGGPRLFSWLSAAEAAVRFESGGRRRWLRPDGAGTLGIGDERFPFLLEWDRGTERVPVLTGKLTRYAEYDQACRTNGAITPTLLFVTTTPQREQLLWQVAQRELRDFTTCLRTTTASLFERLGPLNAVWLEGCQRQRTAWPKHTTVTTTTWN